MKPFLTAKWTNLILLTYAIDPLLLKPYLPKGLALDVVDGRAFVSLVAFEFLNTKLRGIPIPFHANFPEINLRFYVKYGQHRGVVFIKELVPKYFVALIANKIYNEPYFTAKMNAYNRIETNQRVLEHRFNYNEYEHFLRFKVENKPYEPASNTTSHYFKEHEWGFGQNKRGLLTGYRVEHPVWRIYPLKSRFDMDIHFGALYGEQWTFLNTSIPYNILVAEGSDIKVFPGKVMTSPEDLKTFS